MMMSLRTLLFALLLLTSAVHAANVCPPNRGPSATPTSDFVVHGNGTVTHAPTGLMWKQCNEGLSGAACNIGTATKPVWGAALTSAKNSTFAGYDDWRLPNKQELESLIDDTCYLSSINDTVFPGTVGTESWTSTTQYLGAAGAWTVNFQIGTNSGANKSDASYVAVRHVRGGQAFDGVRLCDLDVNGDGAVTAASDGVLLLRFMLGMRGAALVFGVPLSAARPDAMAVETFIGSTAQYDVFGQPSAPANAMQDGLVLLRLMSAVPDTALLNAIALPAGAIYSTGSTVRSNVNARCGTAY